MSITPQAYAQVRAEIIELFGWDADGLSPDRTLRVDCAVALRIGLDDQHARIMRGEPVDMPKMLTVSEALSRLLPPAVLATPPSEQREDRDAAVAPLLKLFRHLHESVHTLSAENAHLKAALKAGSAPGSVPALSDVAIDPDDVVPPTEWRGETYAGMRPGPDDPKPRRRGPVIEGKVAPPSPAARPPQNWDDTAGGKAWRAWVDAGGSVGGDRWSNRNIP
jgi:hypothetical protein